MKLFNGRVLGSFIPLLLAATLSAQGERTKPTIQQDGEFYVLNFSEDQNEGMNLEELVKLCQEVTGTNFTYAQETGGLLRDKKVIMYGSKRIPKEDFYEFFQIQMFINEFVCVTVGPPHISVILIQEISRGRQGAGTIRTKAVHVHPDDLPKYADQPATLITTVLDLPNLDVRNLTKDLRLLQSDNITQGFMPAGESSVILQGFGSQIAALARLLLFVDEASAVEPDSQPAFDVVPLAHAAAEEVADLIDQLLQASRTANDSSSSRRQQGVSAALQPETLEPKVLVDSRTNSLLVMALPGDMPRIKDLVAQLDVEVVEPESNFHVYELQNVNATDIEGVLEKFLADSERVSRNATGGSADRSSRTTDEVTVVADPKANALLIAANKSRYAEVLSLVRQLDQRQDQVLIETALIELSGTDFRDIGVELGLADVMGDGGFGVTSFGLSAITDSDMDGVPDLRTPLQSDGLIGGILSGDAINLPLLIRATERTDGANVLNVPSVLVNNNGTAHVATKDEQPTTQVTVPQGIGSVTQQNFRDFEEAGITLEISPSISASRHLRLDISLVVSTFVGSFTDPTIPPPRITRELKTVVNVPDGDTMVIGGIITDNMDETVRKTPILGDIPLLQHLFRRSTKTNTRRTLYFFVTPHILADRDFTDLAEISFRKKVEAAKSMGLERVQVFDPRFGTDAEGVDFEEFRIPLYRSPARGEAEGRTVDVDPAKREELRRKSGDH